MKLRKEGEVIEKMEKGWELRYIRNIAFRAIWGSMIWVQKGAGKKAQLIDVSKATFNGLRKKKIICEKRRTRVMTVYRLCK